MSIILNFRPTHYLCHTQANELYNKLKAALSSTDAATREGAVAAVAECVNLGSSFDAYAVDLLPELLDRLSDKVAAVADAAQAVVSTVLASQKPDSVKALLPALLGAQDHKKGWQTKVAACNAIAELTTTAPKQLASNLPEVVPIVSASMADAKPQVKTAATETMTKVFTVVNNIDIEAVIPAIVSCIARPAEVPDCIHKLGATTFVQQVEAPTLAVLVPLLVRYAASRGFVVVVVICGGVQVCKVGKNVRDAIFFMCV